MSIVDPIISGVSHATSYVLGGISKSKPAKYMTKKFQTNFDSALAWTTVGSIVVKDGIGCCKYVSQSINNKDIPDDRRPFVTSLDLTNGLLMIGTQIAMFFLMRKYSEKMFNAVFKKSFNAENKSNILTNLRMQAKKAKEMAPNGKDVIVPRKIEAEKAYEEVRSTFLSIFKFVTDVGIATIIGKRILTPFLATPLAGVVEKKVYPHLVPLLTKEDSSKAKEKDVDDNIEDAEIIDEIKDADDVNDVEDDD